MIEENLSLPQIYLAENFSYQSQHLHRLHYLVRTWLLLPAYDGAEYQPKPMQMILFSDSKLFTTWTRRIKLKGME